MPLILAEEGLVFVSDEASATTSEEVMRPEVVAAAGSPTREVRRGDSPASGSTGGRDELLRSDWIQLGYDPALAGFLEQACVDPGLTVAGAPRTIDELLMSRATSPFGQPTAMVRRLAASYAVTHAMIAGGAGGVAPPAKRRLTLGAPARGGKPARAGGQSTTSVTTSAPASAPELGVITAQKVEHEEKCKQAAMLAEFMGPARVAEACGCRPAIWAKMPRERANTTWEKHATSFSAGRLGLIRRALCRLEDWMEVNDLQAECADFWCEGGVLAWWVQDEQAKSKTEGLTVPASLRGGLVGAYEHFGFKKLGVYESVFKNVAAAPGRTPKPAKSATTGMLLHFVRVARDHEADIVRRYAAGFVLCMLSCMRVRDAQRAALSFGVSSTCAIKGLCYSSKHPRRRQPKEMPVYVPPTEALLGRWDDSLRRSATLQPDYTFPRVRVPRSQTIEHPGVTVLDGPAKSAYVIKVLRWTLVMFDFMTLEEANVMTGHSLRHWLGTVGRLLGYSEEDRSELGRWIAATTEGVARRGSLPNRYSNADAEEPRVLALVTRLLSDTMRRVREAGGPAGLSKSSPWAVYAEGGVAVCDDVGAEASSSESSDSEAAHETEIEAE